MATLEYRRRYVADDMTSAARCRIVAYLVLAVALLAGGALCGERWWKHTEPPLTDTPTIPATYNRVAAEAQERTVLVASGLLLGASFCCVVAGVRVMMAPESRRSWAEQTGGQTGL